MTNYKEPMIAVTLQRVREGVFHVFRGEDILVLNSGQPEHDACRALLVQGITGTLVTRHRGENYDSGRMDIEWGATHTSVPGDGKYYERLSQEKYEAAMERARAFINAADLAPTPAEQAAYHAAKAAMVSGEARAEEEGAVTLSPERFEQIEAWLEAGTGE